jgi:acylphosphatase
MPTVGRRVRVSGRVQGVFFRGWTRDEARQLGVAGWVRNCPDGSVEAHIEGEEAVVDQLIARMRSGPSGAEVDHQTVEDVSAEQLESFEVRH